MLDNTVNRPQRLLHLDLLRLLAIYLVIFNHTGIRGYMLFSEETGSIMYYPHMVVSILCKVAVPIFFMISGALLLPKQETFRRLFTKRVLRMVAVLFLISVPYYLWLHRSMGLSPYCFLTYIYGNSASTSLWYLYSYVALLLMLPFLRSMVKAMQEKDYLYLIAGYLLLFGVLPCVEFCLWKGNVTIHESFTPVFFLTPNIFYALAGYYLEHVMDHQKNKKYIYIYIYIYMAFSAAAVFITCVITHYQRITIADCSPEQIERFFNCFICIPAMTLYCLMKHLAGKINNARLQTVLPFLGGTVFGVYLIEKFCRALMAPVYVAMEPIIGSFAASLTWALATLCLSMIIVAALKCTPGINKLVNRFI